MVTMASPVRPTYFYNVLKPTMLGLGPASLLQIDNNDRIPNHYCNFYSQIYSNAFSTKYVMCGLKYVLLTY